MEIKTTPAPKGRTDRRDFLKWSGGALLAGGLLLESCKKKDDDDNVDPQVGRLTLTNDDFGILNYAYALEQLEADFYDRVVNASNFNANFTMGAATLLREIAAHEKAHREFFKAALGTNAIQKLTPKYGSLDFNDKNAVLTTAKTFEDLGVSAYNGAGPKITNSDYLTLAGKIVSVEARHAAFIRELIREYNGGNGMRFIDTDVATVQFSRAPQMFQSPIDNPGFLDQIGFDATTNNAFEIAKTPTQVLQAAQGFITETLVNQIA